MLELYAIAATRPPAGLDGVRAVGEAGLYAVYGQARGARGVEPMLEHERVVEALMAQGPVLPARFGTTAASEGELRGELRLRAGEFREQLAHVEGCVELAVHAPPSPALCGLARASAQRSPRGTAYLVPAVAADEFRARARAAGATCTGPWPPYSFVDGLGRALDRRVQADPENLERGLAQLVLTIVELLRQLMERQALRRIDAGGLSEEQVERLGTTFMLLSQRMEELKDVFGLDERDLNLDLGPLGRLL